MYPFELSIWYCEVQSLISNQLSFKSIVLTQFYVEKSTYVGIRKQALQSTSVELTEDTVQTGKTKDSIILTYAEKPYDFENQCYNGMIHLNKNFVLILS